VHIYQQRIGLKGARSIADTWIVSRWAHRTAATWLLQAAIAGLLGGCGGAGASVAGVTPSTSGPITKAQALAYARAVNLQPADMPGFSSIGREAEAPAPGRYILEYTRCHGGIDPARRVASISSAEFSTGTAFDTEIMKSTVEVWPTPSLLAINSSTAHSSRGRACFVRYLHAVHKHLNQARKGRMQIGPFTISIVPNPLPGVSHSFLTAINETRLQRGGAVRAHIYRDIFGFISGAAEVELEAVGFGHPVPTPAEEKALLLLLDRARASAIR
jgi:hypothetical protein